MASTEGIFSMRLVIADFYMEKPITGLDPSYSEFRGKEIKKVPIIRIFGSNSQGQKTCMHVHGVFPYFYIPYDQKDFESLNKAIYQIAMNLDKAINISLSQGSSSAQHVFKVQLVKGIPFYGYHRTEHQFLKIYMFNPRFVRRAANLLQNGAIMNKNFHPHESHVPYILQFMIDFNLYGMSFLHVPLEIVKFRRCDASETIAFKNIQDSQILDFNLAKKLSCSSLEVDIGSCFILNRFQIITKTNSSHTNPGIESIWNDERLRRQNIEQTLDDDKQKLKTIPPLEIPLTQERPDAHPTESEIFYRTALLSKLLAIENSLLESSQTINCSLSTDLTHQSNTTLYSNNSTFKQQKRTFNLSKILQNSVYPEECTQNDNLVNASVIQNHSSNNNVFQQSIVNSDDSKLMEEHKIPEDESVFLDDTVIDEELVLSLTQSQNHSHHIPMNATLREEDMELLDILQQLEENNEAKIDLDSSLAPLSQTHKNFALSPELLDKETTASVRQQTSSDSESEGEKENDDNIHDFSIALENLDDLILKLTQTQKESHNEKKDSVPQTDGTDDLPKTPIKRTTTKNPKSPPRTPKNRRATLGGSPSRSPRTPKTCHRYAPLPLVIINRSTGKKTNINNIASDTTPAKEPTLEQDNIPAVSLRKKLAISEVRRNSISVDKEVQDHLTIMAENSKLTKRRSKRIVHLDKTHITCALTPRRTSVNLLKVYSVDTKGNNAAQIEEDHVEREKNKIINTRNRTKNEISETLLNKNSVFKRQEDVANSIQKIAKLEVKSIKQVATRKGSKQTITTANTGGLNAVINVQNTNAAIPIGSKVVSDKKSIQSNKNDINFNRNGTSQTDEVVYAIETEAETEEEILDSDTEPEASIKNLRNTPNLKRLRRSFLTTNTAKRRRLTVSNIEHIVNSSKFETFDPNEISTLLNEPHSNINENKNSNTLNEVEATTFTKNTKVPYKIRKCCVKLRKFPVVDVNITDLKEIKGYETLEKNNLNVQAISIKQINSADNLQIFQLSSESSVNFEKSNEFMVHDQPADSVNYPLSREIIPNSNESSNIKNIDEFETKDTVCGSNHLANVSVSENSFRNVTTKVQLTESSDEEITATPSKNKSKENKALSFKRKSLALHSPLLFTQNSSPSFEVNANLKTSKYPTRSSSLQSEAYITLSSSIEALSNSQSSPSLDTKIVLTPLDLPPSRDEVLQGCSKLQLPEFDFQQPFYSNPDDVTKQKELGFTVLKIPGNKLNDVEEFKSILGTDIKGLSTWRREELLKSAGPEILNKYRNGQRIREYLASQRTVSIQPQMNAPTRQEVKLWLKARELLKCKGEKNEELNTKANDEDSPIKVRRQKVTMMLNAGDEGDGDSDDADCSSRSLTLTPLTPATPAAKDSLKSLLQESFTPLTTKIDKIAIKRDTSIRKYKNLRVLRRVSLTKKLKESLENENSCQSEKISRDGVIPNSQSSETSVSSQTALAALERSSFMQHIQQHDVTIGGLSNNSTMNNTFGFKVALENLQQAKADVELNYLTIVTLEVFVATRDDLYPNPQVDEIRCLFYAIENSIPNDHLDNDKKLPRKSCGYIMVHDPRDIVAKEGRIHGIDRDIEVTVVHTEVEALEALLGLCSRWDPDIYAGYEIEMSSWGFVIERAKYLCLNIAPLLSRVPTQKVREFVDEDRESFTDLDIEMKLCGRILLDVWRLLRSEIALTSYTFENVMYHIMHKRCPWHSYRSLTEWFASPCSRWIVMEYYLERVRGTLSLLDQLDLIGRTSEMAKLIGIQFYEVLSRGSQFRVESMMLRIAKPKNLVPLSPSVQQRAHMRAPEYLALIMEPQSRFYADPLIVLDFQSLYPSMIIGYNYCFSTCLGRVDHLGQSTPFEFGASQLRVSPSMLRKLLDRDLITISPCGVVFVKSSVREGILPRMLTEILDTRQMVKQSMKLHKTNTALQRILHSRQLGLKLMANVTYGYTAANFSGRMPAVEVGDTVVSKGRETLERAIKMVEANEKWNVKVVYGDTDSMFVLVPGRNRAEAFRIGDEIAEAVTKQNPHPVKLKLEKVYQPCILQKKKRYVGYMYETPDQKEPVYEAKGIETVRRDGCPIVAKMLEKVLRILFESADVSQVKQYVCRQFTKLLSGRANLQDLIFAKEFRGLNGYKPTACVPALELTRKWIQNDPRRIPRRGERVPFIITNGPPGVPLIRLIRHPHDVLADEGLKINAIYYITKAIIPPLNRCLLLIGADVNEWFANLPRKILLTPALSVANEVISCPNNTKSKKSTISQFFSTTNCIVDCGRQTKQGICIACNHNPTRSMIILQSKISKIERSYLSTQYICQACCGRVGDLNCGSLDCPVLYVAEVKRRDLQQIMHYRNLLEERF